MGIVTAVLSVLLLSLANYIDQRRILDLAYSIESRALIAKNPRYLQHAITQIVHTGQARGIVIYSTNNKVIAANNVPQPDRKNHKKTQWLISDKNVTTQLRQSLASGVFGIHLLNTPTRRLSILPLGPPIMENNSKVVLGTKWPTPDWHGIVESPKLTPSTLWHRVLAIFSPGHEHKFNLSKNQYAGAIVIETSRDWITSLVLKTILVISGLLAISILIVLLVLSRVLRKNVLGPVRRYTQVITARRSGDYQARVPLAKITEFDKLAYQWNSLLDFRDVAQGQNLVLSTLLEHVPVGIDVTDRKGNIEYANPTFLKMVGFPLAEVIGKSPDSFLTSKKVLHADIGDSLVAITNGETWTGEVVYGRKNGTNLVCSTTFVPIFNRDDKIERLISVRLDITDLKKHEKSLIRAKIKAETADKAKSEFLTNMSHELRTPLNAIIGFSELMAEEKLGPIENNDYIEFSRLIETSSRTLLSSINLVLDMSRLDAHRLQLNETRFCVSELLRKLVKSKSVDAQMFGIKIKGDLQSKSKILTDQRMLHQIFGYLISNAVRFNNEGGQVLISAKEVGKKVVVAIKDNGIGIPKQDLPKVTDPFFRVDSSLDRMKDGAGLGLTLAKKFSREQNIGFDITSKFGKGTTVTLTFPIAKTRPTSAAATTRTEAPLVVSA